MKGLLKVAFLSLMFILNFAGADSENYLSPVKDQNIIDHNFIKKIEVVFYRIGGAKEHVATVKIDDKVVGSLMPNTYAKTYVCSPDFKLGVAHRGDAIGVTNYKSALKQNQNVVFIKVIESNDHKFTLSQVDANDAKNEINGFNLRSNIINRHIPNCDLKQTVAHKVLFKTNSFYIGPNEKKKLEDALEQLKNKEIKRVILKAYADMRSSKEYNIWLATKRGQSVKNFLDSKRSGIEFDIEDVGATNKFADNYGSLKGEALSECLKENRRVDLTIEEK